MVLRSLLSYSRKEIFIQQIEEISEYILSHKDKRVSNIQVAVIEAIPILARFNTGIFMMKYIDRSIQFLLQFGINARTAKEKAICYETLAKIFEPIESSSIKDYLSSICKCIQTELERRIKPFCVEIIHCLEVLRKKFKKKITDYIKIDLLIDLVLLNGLNTYSLEFLKEISKMEIDNLAELVQYKLLMTISIILNGKFYSFPQKNSLDPINIARLLNNLNTEVLTNPDFRSNEAIALSLQALGTFDFDCFAENMALFVKDVVLEYLDNENSEIRKAAARAGCLLYIRKPQNFGQFTITKSHVNDILEKFLSVCLSDPDEKIQETMLESLNDNFDVFLNSSKTLKKLFMCLNDPNYKVKENSLVIICNNFFIILYINFIRSLNKIKPFRDYTVSQETNNANFE